MKYRTRKFYGTAGLLLGIFALSQAYTNCSKAALQPVEMQSLNLPQDHPGAKMIAPAQYTPPLGHRGYISATMTEVFSNAASDAGYVTALDYWVQYWSDNRGDQLGLACNPYESTTGNDCSGNISNSGLPIAAASTTIREAIRIHLCDEILGYDPAVTAALANANVTAAAPDDASIRALGGLFFRADLPSDEFFSSLGEMDQHLALEGLSSLDRWRMVLVEMCESTEWQRL